MSVCARPVTPSFCAPDNEDFRELSLEFIYTIIDPLIHSTFGLCAIEFHEDHNIGYDDIVERLVRSQLKFSIPEHFDLGEISLSEALGGSSRKYKSSLKGELTKIGKDDLLKLSPRTVFPLMLRENNRRASEESKSVGGL